MVRRAPFPRSSLPANIELFNEANLCVGEAVASHARACVLVNVHVNEVRGVRWGYFDHS